jgi:hypothetical protein
MISLSNTNLVSGIDINFIRWCMSYCTDRKQKVRVFNTFSEEISITSGVPQGSLLSPILFSIFVADLQLLKSSNRARLIKYADDTTIVFAVEKDTDLDELTLEIKHVVSWASTNRMTINSSKCKILNLNKSSTSICILLNNIFSIKVCETLKLLGVTFDQKLDFNEHFSLILKRAAQRLYFLRVLKNIYTKEQLWKIFNSLIRSILEYAAPLFMDLPKYLCNDLEKIQRRAHRIICERPDLCNCQIISLESRRVDLGLRLFRKACAAGHPLHLLIPVKRKNRFTLPFIRTNRRRAGFFIQCVININDIFIL